jgi:hypothetical protein
MVLTESEVRNLVLTKSYSASSIPSLEEYLLATCRGESPYVFDAVRTLIKLYQLFPVSPSNDDTSTMSNRKKNTGYACVLAMQHHDFLALSFLIPKAPNSSAASSSSTEAENVVVAASIRCSSLLDACLFAEFWKKYNESFLSSTSKDENTEMLAALARSAIRTLQQTILATLALVYKEAPLQFVMDSLNVQRAEEIPVGNGVVESLTAATVVFSASADNTKRQRVYQEGVSFSTVSALMQKMNTAQ